MSAMAQGIIMTSYTFKGSKALVLDTRHSVILDKVLMCFSNSRVHHVYNNVIVAGIAILVACISACVIINPIQMGRSLRLSLNYWKDLRVDMSILYIS